MYGHLICRIRLKHLEKRYVTFCCRLALFIFHVSLPYNYTGLTSLNLDLNVYIFELMKDTLALQILLTMSSPPPPCHQQNPGPQVLT